MDFHFTTSCVTEPLAGWGKGPGYKVVIKGRRHLSRVQMFLEVRRITARRCPGYEDHLTQNHQSDELKKVAGQMLRRGLIHSRDFVFVKPPKSVTLRKPIRPRGRLLSLRVRFFNKIQIRMFNPKTDTLYFVFLTESKTDQNDPQRRWILWIISKTEYFGYMIRSVSLLRIRKE